MNNADEFQKDAKYQQLSPAVRKGLDTLDEALKRKNYRYKAIWRDARESGGHVFIFEVERKRGRRKNLITLRPQQSFLRVEVYWSQTDKHYFDLLDPVDPNNLPPKMLEEIDDMYNKIAF